MTTQHINSRLHASSATAKCVHNVFEQKCSINGNTVISTEQTSMTYSELDQRSTILANRLLRDGIQSEQIVAVLMERSLDALVAQLGILKSSAAYLPLSPNDFPLERISSIFEDASVSYVIAQKEYKHLLDKIQSKTTRRFSCFFLDSEEIDGHGPHDSSVLIKDVRCSPGQRAYVMYTSGSSGRPKGVMITHENIVSSVTDTNYLNFNTHDAMLHAAPISFDAATFEIWGALLNALPLYIASSRLVSDFDLFSKFVIDNEIKIAWLTSALCNLIADSQIDFFSNLSLLLVGGEALSPPHINKIRRRYPELSIRNNYGPTENTIFSTSHLIEKDYQKTVPIGRAVSHKRAYVLDAKLRPALPGQLGELFVAGKGIASGYLNRPEETKSKFIVDPFHEGELMYATGDLCRYNNDGEIEYVGRTDDQIKVMGHRIELGEIEAALYSCPGLDQALVLYKPLSETSKGIVAYVSLTNTSIANLKAQLRSILPAYMVPTYFEEVEHFPLTLNGKIDRQALTKRPLKTENPLFSIKPLSQEQVRKIVIEQCCLVLKTKRLDPSQSFFDLGGDSLTGTQLMVELTHALGKELPLQTLYAKPVINDLVNSIIYDKKQVNQRVSTETLRNDARLPQRIINGCKAASQRPIKESNQKILLTGATGFFGSFLLKELLANTKHYCFCIVRSEDADHGLQRILETMKKYKISISQDEIDRILAIPGDLDKPNFGLEDNQFVELSALIGEIFHCGASVNYVDTYEKLKPTNVNGSKEILRLASMNQLIPVHYISSVSVFETVGFFTGKQWILENESVDSSADLVKLGYSQSKWVAEKLMENAQQAGMPVNIYRTGYIMGHSQTGVSNTTDHIARYIAGCIEMACAPILNEYASLAPVDQLSRALKYIALSKQPRGKTYHLCNPNFTTVSEIYKNIQNFGFSLELVPYEDWKCRFEQASIDNPLYPLLSLHIHSAPDHQLTLPELYERNARFDCSELLSALQDSDITISMNDDAIFERWLVDYVEQGLIQESTYQQALVNQSSSLEVAC